MSLFHDSTCFEHKCSSSGGQNCTIQPLVSSKEQMYIQSFHHNNELIPEQHPNEHKPMFDLLHSNTTRHNPPEA